MDKEKFQYYGELLEKYFFSKRTDKKVQDEVDSLADKDPVFKELLVDVMIEMEVGGLNKRVCLRMLQDFSQRKPVDFDDTSLVGLGDLYQHNPWFRAKCVADKALREASTFWLDEYYRRVSSDETFAGYVLLRKLQRFLFWKLGFYPPVEFDEKELALLDQLSQTNPEFQKMLDEHTESVRNALTYVLEEREKEVSEDKKP